jgi:DNA repair protein RecN (Recombination protein N)
MLCSGPVSRWRIAEVQVLVEIRVRDLGVIEDLKLVLGPGMTALTGETGAGKTLVVEALELLVGGRADAALVRRGAEKASVEGRFATVAIAETDGGTDDDIVVSREIPADGRSRAYIDGQMAAVSALAALGSGLVDLHGQHAHQSLLHQQAQRQALDRFGGIDVTPAEVARERVAQLDARLLELGGDTRQLARELDLLKFQVGELDAAQLSDPDEEAALEAEEALLSAADALKLAASAARAHLTEPDNRSGSQPEVAGASELLGVAAALLSGHDQLSDLAGRLRAALSDVTDVAAELRQRAETFESDPERLATTQGRRRQLSELRRKYGDRLSDVIAFAEVSRRRLEDLGAGEERRAELAEERLRAIEALELAEQRLGDARRAVAPALSQAIAGHLAELALPNGRIEIRANGRMGDDVEWLFGANPGEAALPLEKVASGGELARLMLATRLVLTQAPPTLVFDEVDAGIGGEAALAVGRALHQLALAGHQVLVVTHLAQVAAFADAQVAVTKEERNGRSVAEARVVESEERLAELSRMLSGQPASAAARQHASELLSLAGTLRHR